MSLHTAPHRLPRIAAALLCAAVLLCSLLLSRAARAGATATNGDVYLTWSAQGDPNSPDDSNYYVYRSGNGGTLTYHGMTGATSYVDTAVANGNTYRYRVHFDRTIHNFYADPDGVVRDHPTTQTIVVLDETVEVSLGAASIGATLDKGKVVVSWGAVSNATGYSIDKSVNGGAFFFYVTTANPTFTDAGVFNGTTVAYRVRATNNAGPGL